MRILIFLLFLDPYISFAHELSLEAIEVVEREDTQGLVDFVPSAKKIYGDELVKKRQTSLGDSLASEPGVHSTSFGPNASRPVVRGLDGDRLKVLQNGLGSLDASTQSLDHAIPVDSLTIDQIEFNRGPMSLLYGSSAVGGVVNLVTNRIHFDYEEGLFTKFFTQAESVNNGLSSAAHLNYGINKWMFHLDGSTRNLGNVSVPGTLYADDKIPNSANKQDNIAFGISKIYDRGYVGISVNHFNTFYGSLAEEDVSIDMSQNRIEFHSEYRPVSGVFRKWKLKSAQSNYFHRELEDDVTGTKFKNDGNVTRLEAVNQTANWDGVWGIQSEVNEFSAKGEEAFLPSSITSKFALFGFQQLSLGKSAYRFSIRIEDVNITKESSVEFLGSDKKNYVGLNTSIGHCYDFTKRNTIETSLSYTERAPTFQELYADGNHVATGTQENGDSHLVKEKASALELTFKDYTETNELVMSVYAQFFKDYILLSPTGQTNVDGFSINNYEQENAIFYGIDLENRKELKKIYKGSLFLINKFDLVRAKNSNNGKDLPRISPPRFSAGLEFKNDRWSSDIDVQYVFEQQNTAQGETKTEDYIFTNIGYTYNLAGNISSLDMFFRVRNLFNVDGRNHVSTLKDIAPLAGRNFILGLEFQI